MNNIRDFVTVKDEQGNTKEFAVEALFDMDDHTYALLTDKDETVVMKVEGTAEEQFLVAIEDQDKIDAILSAYQIAVEASPASDEIQ
ncbi:DUF1292 domain-containing protein [Pseudalkalibacillus caeni]|uniref:DUF1292 domain-containing protein n=1 Tax=Exobacillus caeni TaxID=2574798 RepID=A0A5R9FA40_9BACL|nr:DUF1292 domain-containing protein [Pseudalkalibacillus caeni]TLS37434.1 DUF1292 domain-containing protein [Pseudalkalibacillus caeni]